MIKLYKLWICYLCWNRFFILSNPISRQSRQHCWWRRQFYLTRQCSYFEVIAYENTMHLRRKHAKLKVIDGLIRYRETLQKKLCKNKCSLCTVQMWTHILYESYKSRYMILNWVKKKKYIIYHTGNAVWRNS